MMINFWVPTPRIQRANAPPARAKPEIRGDPFHVLQTNITQRAGVSNPAF